jgi:hypothetical protein
LAVPPARFPSNQTTRLSLHFPRFFMTYTGPFRIPEKCIDCMFVQATLADFEQEQEDLTNKFKDFGYDLEEAEAIYHADSPEALRMSEPARVLMRQRWREAIHKLTLSTVEIQALFDDIDKECPGNTDTLGCNFPLKST